MENHDFVFLNTYYDKEVLRRALFFLKNGNIEFKTINKSNQGNFRVPVNKYEEVDILVLKSDYERAIKLLET